MNYWKEFSKGLLSDNPVLVMLLGMCSVLAVSTSVINTFRYGVCCYLCLVMANIVISSIRKIVPSNIRIPVYIV